MTDQPRRRRRALRVAIVALVALSVGFGAAAIDQPATPAGESVLGAPP